MTQKISSKTFTDCAEVSVRHLINFLSYNYHLKVFNLISVRPLQFLKEKEEVNWLIEKYKDIFIHLNPTYRYNLQAESLYIDKLKSGEVEYGGCLKVTVLDPHFSSFSTTVSAERETPLFCFNLNIILNRHTFINNLKILNLTAPLPNLSMADLLKLGPFFFRSA